MRKMKKKIYLVSMDKVDEIQVVTRKENLEIQKKFGPKFD